MTAFATIHYFAVDPVAIGYIVIIIAIWLISMIRGLARRAQQRSRASRPASAVGPADAGPNSGGVAAAQSRLSLLQRGQPAAPLKSVAQAQAPFGVKLSAGPAAVFGTVDRRPTQAVEQVPNKQPTQLLYPILTPSAIASAVIAAAVIGPCVAYRAHDHDLIGW
mgnify:CR=1 FL=1